MALIANNVIELQTPATVNYTLGEPVKFGNNLQASKFVDVTKDKINSEAAAVRPLIKNYFAPVSVEPVSEVEVKEEEIKTEPTTNRKEVHQEVLVKRRVVGRSRYLSDMLTVE
jgi:hypothetical protein